MITPLSRSFAVGALLGLIAASAVTFGMHSEVRGDHHMGIDAPQLRLKSLHPGTGHIAYYTLCSADPATQQIWAIGPETWQSEMLGAIDMRASSAQCSGSGSVEVVLLFEFGGYTCDDSLQFACRRILPGDSFVHNESGLHDHVSKYAIAWDADHWAAYPDVADRTLVSVHEFGHVMSLGDHSDPSPCDEPKLIMRYDSLDGSPCTTVPNESELCSAYDAYNYTLTTDNEPLTTPGLANDVTIPMSDEVNNGCDADADNDGLPNRGGGATPNEGTGCNGSGPLDPLKADTDGDRVRDGAECVLGSNPNDPNSKPSTVGDADSDTIPSAMEILFGWNPSVADSDGDGIHDGIEYKGYSTNPTAVSSDGDGCRDVTEIASVNSDYAVGAVDLSLVAQNFGRTDRPVQDVNKDGTVSALDLNLVAAHFGGC